MENELTIGTVSRTCSWRSEAMDDHAGENRAADFEVEFEREVRRIR